MKLKQLRFGLLSFFALLAGTTLAGATTVSFAPGEATGAAYVPEAVQQEAGTTINLPLNYTMYVEGKTLTAWSDGTNNYAPGAAFAVPAQDVTLTAVFTANEVSLADRTAPVTLRWDFQKKNGAPNVQWQNKDNLVWVVQTTIGGKTIDVALPFTTVPGKFNNTNWTDWCQLNEGTTFHVPSCKGATISMEAYGSITTTTIDGQSDYTQGTTISYTIGGSAESVDVVIGDGSYYRYIQVVLPVVQSQGGQSYTNEATTVEWPMSDPADYSHADVSPEGIFSTVGVDLGAVRLMDQNGNENVTGTSTVSSGVTFILMRPTNGASDYVTWVVKPVAGLTFTPKKLTAYIVRFGTDAQSGVTFSAKVGEGEAQKLGTFTAPRNNKSKADDKYGSSADYAENGLVEIELTAEQQAALTSGESLSIMGTVGVGNNKAGGIAKVTLTGVVNGTVANVNTYQLAAVAAPAEGGTVSVYPAAEEYEENSEVTLTATEAFGYDFVNWTNKAGEVVSTEPKFKYTVTANETLTANFKAVPTYELALTVDGTNAYMVSVNPAPNVVDGKWMYEGGQAVQLTANQYEGLVTFNNWSDGDTGASKLLQMNGAVQLTAHYAQADIIAGWDFYNKGSEGRKADFYAPDNDGDALNLVNTETGETSGWLDKSTEAANGYESFKGAAVNWRTGTQNGDVGHWHWQTKVNAAAFTDINVQFQMLYNYNAYQTYDAEYSLDGEQWTKFGSITMTGAKAPASFSKPLPAEANNQAQLYIRMLADKTSQVDGSASANDGNTLAMFFITGTPKLVDDGVAPVLVSTVPANEATGVSASGKIVLTFDERVKMAEGAKGMMAVTNNSLGAWQVEPTVSGKTITFIYKGLDYGTAYNFSLPAGSVADLTDNYTTQPITLTFTTMERPSVEKGLYDAVVENAEQLVNAIQAAESRADKNVRFRIFLKNGTYQLPLSTTATINSDDGNTYPSPITNIAASNVSFIGESQEGVIITNAIDNSKEYAGQYGTTSVYDGIGKSDVLQIQPSVTGTYFQDLTVKSGMIDARGRNIAVQDKGRYTIYKNTCLWGYQDTWTSNNDNGYYYFEGGKVRGRTDFLCGKGDAFFNAVNIQMCMNTGGYIAVPSKSIQYGYVFQGCTIDGESQQLDGKYTLGRPWGQGTPAALWINTRMNIIPSAIGWSEMSNGWPKRFAEYNSTTSTGTPIDLSGRKKVFGDGHANNPVLTADEALEAGNLHNVFGEWDPTLATEQAPIPQNVKQEGNSLVWDGSNYALLWAVVKDGSIVGFTTEPAFVITADGTYAVRAANEMGGLSDASDAVQVTDIATGIHEAATQQNDAPEAIYNLSGLRVQKTQKGLYIVNGRKVVIK
jgi:hypothetical protein